MQVVAYLLFYVVDQIVAEHNIHIWIDFNVNRSKYLAGTVIVHHQIMNSQNSVKIHGLFFNVVYKIGIGSFTEKRADRFLYQTDSGPQNEESNSKAQISVYLHIEKVTHEDSCQNYGSGYDIVSAVGAGSNQRKRVDLFSGRNIK